MSLANISIVGNLAREPERHQFTSGRVKTTLVVAVNGFNAIRKEKTTDFYRVEIWDRLGELARNYLKKGNQVAVSGKLGYERWTDRDGKDRITPCVQANQLALPPRLKPYPDPPPAAAKAVPLDNKPEDPDVILDGHTDVDSEDTSEKSDSDEMQENASMHFDDQSDGSLACDESDTTSDAEQSVEQVEESSEEDIELAKSA